MPLWSKMVISKAVVGSLLLAATQVWAGGAWIPEPGKGNIQLGFSRKTADTVWDAEGKDLVRHQVATDPTTPTHYHDFRYGLLSGEVGLRRRLSGTFLFTYLWGFEGYRPDDLETNFGFSDAWVGLKFQVREGAWPQALRVSWRTPFLYDQQGPYARHLYSVKRDAATLSKLEAGQVVADTVSFVMNNPEWRGLNRNDLALLYSVSHSFRAFPGWMSLEAGYNFRQGGPADDIPVNFELGYSFKVKSHSPHLKLGLNLVKSAGNNSPSDPHDRFNFPANFAYDFNDASMFRGGLSLLWPIDKWVLEAGYNQWLWGRGARKYKEPFVGLSRNL